MLWDMAGGKVRDVAPEATPYYWRDGVYVANFKMQWNFPALNDTMLQFVDKVKEALMPHALEGCAAYVNYIDPTVQDWQYAYYGKNYRRLQEVKAKWDPTYFFHFPQGIEPLGFDKKPASGPVPPSGPISPPIAGDISVGIPIFNRDTDETETERRIPVDDDGNLLTGLALAAAMWTLFGLPDPLKLWELDSKDSEPDTDKVLMVIGGERVEAETTLTVEVPTA